MSGWHTVVEVGVDLDAWGDISVDGRVGDGQRNEVWAGTSHGTRVAVRRSRRSPVSLAWELDLLRLLDDRGFVVPLPIPTVSGDLTAGGVVVQRWIDGRRPSSRDDWRLVADELRRLHAECRDVAQRPGCRAVIELTESSRSVDADLNVMPADVVTVVLAVFRSLSDVDVALIHGDPGPSNIRIQADGRVGLLDWDESRVDIVWHDLSNLGVQVLADQDHVRARRLSDAWEAANAWVAEPAYARHRLASLTADRSIGGR